MLQPDRYPQQRVGRGAARALNAFALLDQALDAAQARGPRKKLQPPFHGRGGGEIALYFQRKHGPAAAWHLAAGQGMLACASFSRTKKGAAVGALPARRQPSERAVGEIECFGIFGRDQLAADDVAARHRCIRHEIQGRHLDR